MRPSPCLLGRPLPQRPSGQASLRKTMPMPRCPFSRARHRRLASQSDCGRPMTQPGPHRSPMALRWPRSRPIRPCPPMEPSAPSLPGAGCRAPGQEAAAPQQPAPGPSLEELAAKAANKPLAVTIRAGGEGINMPDRPCLGTDRLNFFWGAIRKDK
jgi:hypothetical protein